MNRLLLIVAIATVCSAFLPANKASAQDCDVLPCRVDFNKDGCVTIDDIFFLVDPTMHPFFDELLDINEDGLVDGNDGALFGCMMNAQACWILGDYNDDGVVSAADLTTFLAAWGTFNPCVDLTGDGMVGVQDYIIFLNQFGMGG